MKRRLLLLGSTGSIGTQTLDVVRAHPDAFCVTGLAAGGGNLELLAQQAVKLGVEGVAVADPAQADRLRTMLPAEICVYAGPAGVRDLCLQIPADLALAAVVGVAGLPAVLACIERRMDVALANKEVLVAGGALVTRLAREQGVRLLPVDSEHSAIFQCLQGGARPERLILTASGGPFFGYDRRQLSQVTVEDALAHPNWTMGAKITVDCSTLMNKGLEVIEARWLFDVEEPQIDVMIHRSSVIHSMVEFPDGAVLAQLGTPDMRTAIQYALTYPERAACPSPRLDLLRCPPLEFFPVDDEAFPCLSYAREALRRGRGAATALNAANEVGVEAFLQGRIGYLDIERCAEKALAQEPAINEQDLEAILALDAQTRAHTLEYLRQ